MKMELPFPVLHSLFLLNQAGYEAYVVGGCVRDVLMGKEPTDWDITTSALPEETILVFNNYRTIETGIKHGTVTVIVEDLSLEITTYRVDGDYTDGRHPDKVSFTRSLEEDLKRRDFTVNSMAYHPQIGLVDPFHGQQDLRNKTIRCVGDPNKRFSEDALRILRGLRFASTLAFTVHPDTSEAIHRLADALQCVSAERIAVEFTKLLCGMNKSQVLCEYSDVLSVILPNINYEHAAKSVVYKTPLLNFVALMSELAPEVVEESCKRLRLSHRMTEDITTLVRYRNIPLEPTRSCILHTLHLLGPHLTSELLQLRTVSDTLDSDAFRTVWGRLMSENDCCYQLKDLSVNGEDLVAISIPAGPEVGTVLNRLLNAVMDGTCPNEKVKLLELATKKPVQ